MPLGDHAGHWSSYIGEVIRGVPLYYPSWLKVLKEKKSAFITDIGRQSSTTQEYPSLIDTFFVAHTVNGEFLRDEDRRIYEMRRLEATGTYTDDEINRLAREGKQRGNIPGVGRVLPARATASPSTPAHFKSGGANGSGGCGDDEEGADDQDDEDEDGDGDT
nr:F-box domain, leucine-rich repeat domain, L domain-like protein [Tanacetum cinerariifolium]